MHKATSYLLSFSYPLLLVMLAIGIGDLLILNTDKISISSYLWGLAFGLPYLSKLIGKKDKFTFKKIMIIFCLYYVPVVSLFVI